MLQNTQYIFSHLQLLISIDYFYYLVSIQTGLDQITKDFRERERDGFFY